MKILPYVFLMFLVAIAGIIVFNQPKQVSAYQYDYFRLHIMANSNEVADQELKFVVKEKLIDFFTPYLADATTKEEAIDIVQKNLDVAKLLIDKSLIEAGVDYGCEISVNKEHFPTRYYEEFCLEEGVYEALIVSLGEGKGNNWWCVVYPPLCFVNKNVKQEQDIVYQSKILEIINRYFK